MSSVLPTPLRPVAETSPARSALLIGLAGFFAMYLPLWWWASHSLWQSEEQGHGAIILAVMVWLFWTLRRPIDTAPVAPRPLVGWPVFAVGLFAYLLGTIFGINFLTFLSQPLIAAALLLLLRGPAAVKIAWFPLVYFIFMVPLPNPLVDAITGSLKGLIANIVESLLYAAGYPIARSGVILSIGPYQLQVADACSGLHSMFSLTALGTLFMYMVGRKSRLHMGIMLASILPIAFVSNIVRVMVLVLVTYYLGDEAGQGFLHGAAGMVLMLVALVSFFLLDLLLDKLLPAAPAAPAAAGGNVSWPGSPSRSGH